MENDQEVFGSYQEAEDYWNKHFGGQYEDPDVSLAFMERWMDGVTIED